MDKMEARAGKKVELETIPMKFFASHKALYFKVIQQVARLRLKKTNDGTSDQPSSNPLGQSGTESQTQRFGMQVSFSSPQENSWQGWRWTSSS